MALSYFGGPGIIKVDYSGPIGATDSGAMSASDSGANGATPNRGN